MDRTIFAQRLVAGLAGWFQQLAAQDLHEEVGEDAARVELVRMISAQRKFVPETSRRPINWPRNNGRRIDVAVLGRSQGAEGWYGAIELKWPGISNDRAALRRDLVQDAMRVAFSRTSNMNARFVVLGGSTTAIARLFDQVHPEAQPVELQREAFAALFSRELANAAGSLSNESLLTHFPQALARIPPAVTVNWSRRFATQLLATSEARVGPDVMGRVFIWQCRK